MTQDTSTKRVAFHPVL